jgi:hypothetical protein
MQRVLNNASKNKNGFVLSELLRVIYEVFISHILRVVLTTLSSGFIVVLWLQAMALLLHLQNRQRQRNNNLRGDYSDTIQIP